LAGSAGSAFLALAAVTARATGIADASVTAIGRDPAVSSVSACYAVGSTAADSTIATIASPTSVLTFAASSTVTTVAAIASRAAGLACAAQNRAGIGHDGLPPDFQPDAARAAILAFSALAALLTVGAVSSRNGGGSTGFAIRAVSSCRGRIVAVGPCLAVASVPGLFDDGSAVGSRRGRVATISASGTRGTATAFAALGSVGSCDSRSAGSTVTAGRRVVEGVFSIFPGSGVVEGVASRTTIGSGNSRCSCGSAGGIGAGRHRIRAVGSRLDAIRPIHTVRSSRTG
jgi:hypothetical protein